MHEWMDLTRCMLRKRGNNRYKTTKENRQSGNVGDVLSRKETMKGTESVTALFHPFSSMRKQFSAFNPKSGMKEKLTTRGICYG